MQFTTSFHIFEAWQSGSVSDQEALTELLHELDEIDGVYKRAVEAREHHRTRIEAVVKRLGGRGQAAGYDVAVIEPSRPTVSYDAAKLDALMAEMLAAGDIATAQRLADARIERTRSAHLRVVRVRD